MKGILRKGILRKDKMAKGQKGTRGIVPELEFIQNGLKTAFFAISFTYNEGFSQQKKK